MAHARDPIIETRGACSGATVRDATMKLNGGLVGLVGANGAGKTTIAADAGGGCPL